MFQGLFLFHLCQKLNVFKPKLKSLNGNNFGDIHGCVLQAMEALLVIQNAKLSHFSEDLTLAERDWSQQSSELLVAEESFLRQRSRVKWFKEGDQNTRFFHNYVNGKHVRLRISSLINAEGHLITDEAGIKEEILGFYKGLLGSEDDNCTGSTVFGLRGLLSFRLSNDLAASLLKPVTAADIKAVIFSMPSNKSPGLDGYTSEFFKASWGDCWRFGYNSYFGILF